MTRFSLAILAGMTAAFAGCSQQPPPRPAAGDTVYPIVHCPKSWQAGQAVILQVKLGVQQLGQDKPELLQFEEVPHEPELRANLTFCKGDEVVSTLSNVLLVPDC